jgi:acrylyl-CoA reductase (NADPH)
MWRALWASERDSTGAIQRIDLRTDLTDDVLTVGDVWLDVAYSSINFKDALALGGRPGIVRVAELIPGIDVVGTVTASNTPEWKTGDRVLVNGRGLGEIQHGGLGQRARVSSEWLVAVPPSISQSQAAAIGTAGLAAMLAVLELERGAVSGDIVVTGAAGGAGSIAVALLSKLGHRVTAVTGREDEHDFLFSLGAHEILDRAALSTPGKPLQSQRWTGAIDAVGGEVLSNVISQINYGGTVAAFGNARSSTLTVSMMPFILRAVSLVGVNTVQTPRGLRLEAWDRLAKDLDLGLLDSLTAIVPLVGSQSVSERVLAGQVRGRTVVDVNA